MVLRDKKGRFRKGTTPPKGCIQKGEHRGKATEIKKGQHLSSATEFKKGKLNPTPTKWSGFTQGHKRKVRKKP